MIDAIKGHYLWAEKYDRKFKDIFMIMKHTIGKRSVSFSIYLVMIVFGVIGVRAEEQ